MGVVLGIDVGGSTTKIVGLRDGALMGVLQVRAGDQMTALFGAIGNFLRERSVSLGDVSEIILTGVGASFIGPELIYGIRTRKVNEFQALGQGGLSLSGLDEALVVSMGTGTAFVRAGLDGAVRVGGSGVGGGTVLGLASQMLGKSDINAILAMAESGKPGNIDLTVGDITGCDIPSLPSELTAANFGKISSMASEADIALGIVNMVFETVGMLAVFALRNDSIRDVALTGTLATFPQAGAVFSKFTSLTGLNFVIPENAAFATALGAAVAAASPPKLREES